MAGSVPQAGGGTGAHVILYDGVCGLCNGLNRFVLPRDRRAVFDFASLQSPAGRALVERFGKNPDDLNTVYVVTDYRSPSPSFIGKSRAVLFILRQLGWPWRWLALPGRVLPRAMLDRGYDLVARNRYRIFGRYDTCLVPAAEYKRRFIDV